MSFSTLGLRDSLLQAVSETGYTIPTPIQSQAIPAILSGQDVMAAAQTGTGKTAGFVLPLLQQLANGERVNSNRVRALILTPTRELAAQIRDSIKTYGKNEALSSVVVFGGVNINPQLMAMRKGADILVATPGRLLDLFQKNAVNFNDLEVLVLDEADRMLDMGFINDIRRILKLLPAKRQNLMFSATFSREIRELAKGICRQPVEIDVAPRNSTVETITQHIYEVRKEDKLALLTTVLKSDSAQTLVFSRTKHGANKLVKVLLKAGLTAAAIHGNKSQSQRTKALADFKQDKVQVLVATDIAARGIDIDLLARVINFDLPNVPEDYVHRIGRTGRAGASGVAISLVAPEEIKLLRDIERVIRRKVERVVLPELEVLDGEQPDFSDRPRGQSSRQQTSNRQSGNRQSDNRQGGRSARRSEESKSDDSRPSRRRSGGGRNSQAARADGNGEYRNGKAASENRDNRSGEASARGNQSENRSSGSRRRRSGKKRDASPGNAVTAHNKAHPESRPAEPKSSSTFSRIKNIFRGDSRAA